MDKLKNYIRTQTIEVIKHTIALSLADKKTEASFDAILEDTRGLNDKASIALILTSTIDIMSRASAVLEEMLDTEIQKENG